MDIARITWKAFFWLRWHHKKTILLSRLDECNVHFCPFFDECNDHFCPFIVEWNVYFFPFIVEWNINFYTHTWQLLTSLDILYQNFEKNNKSNAVVIILNSTSRWMNPVPEHDLMFYYLTSYECLWTG